MVAPLPVRISGRTGTLSVTQNATPDVIGIRFSHREMTSGELALLTSHEFRHLQQRYYFVDNATTTLNKAQITA